MNQHVASVRLFVFYLSLGVVWICEIESPHMSKNNGNLDLVCEEYRILGECLWISSLSEKASRMLVEL